MTGKEECARAIKQSRRKMDAHLEEAFTGLTVIRAFKKQHDFTEELNDLFNKITLCEVYEDSCHFFFQVRLFFLSNCMFCCCGVLCIYLRGSYAPLTLALLFQ